MIITSLASLMPTTATPTTTTKKSAFTLILILLLRAQQPAQADPNSVNSQLIPPGALGSNPNGFNVTGSLNSFVEQIQANNAGSNSDSNSIGIPAVLMPAVPQGHGSIIYYGDSTNNNNPNNNPNNNNNNSNNDPSYNQPHNIPFQPTPIQINPLAQQPPHPTVIMGSGQAGPTLDPALQQLLNSFKTNQGAFEARNSFIPGAGQAELNTPIISYVTCYVGCSHVTNIVTNSAEVAVAAVNMKYLILASLATLFILL